jgi:hypothetical protein
MAILLTTSALLDRPRRRRVPVRVDVVEPAATLP